MSNRHPVLAPIQGWLARREINLFNPRFPLSLVSRIGASRTSPEIQEALKDVESLVCFIGYGRSGHSLLGAMLDAHPEMVFAHELHVARYAAYGFSQEQIFRLLVLNSQVFASFGRVWGEYGYAIPGQWQGSWRQLKVIGDKKGGGTARMLAEHPELLESLTTRFDCPVKFIHVTRHPLDLVVRNAQKKNITLPEAVDMVVSQWKAVARVCEAVGSDRCFHSRHEDLVADPKKLLTRICDFLGVEAEPSYLDACASVAFKTPRLARHEVTWPDGVAEDLMALFVECPHMSGYIGE